MLVRVVVFAVVTALLGVATGLVRPMIPGPVHYETIVSLLVVVPLVLLAWVFVLRAVPWQRAGRWVVLGDVAICMAYWAGWSLLVRHLWDDNLVVMALYAVVAPALSCPLLWAYQKCFPLIQGPYCIGCGYCLIGAPEDVCPECGRAFTLSELGVTREDLVAPR